MRLRLAAAWLLQSAGAHGVMLAVLLRCECVRYVRAERGGGGLRQDIDMHSSAINDTGRIKAAMYVHKQHECVRCCVETRV